MSARPRAAHACAAALMGGQDGRTLSAPKVGGRTVHRPPRSQQPAHVWAGAMIAGCVFTLPTRPTSASFSAVFALGRRRARPWPGLARLAARHAVLAPGPA